MGPSDDTEIWRRAVSGDAAAFGLFFDRHKPRVQRHLSRLLTSRQDVEDAAAIVFLEAWRRRRSVRLVSGSALPWLLLTATNVSRNVHRSARRYQALLDRLPKVESHDESSAEEADVVAAMRTLSTADQQVLTLCVLEEWSERDAAEALKVQPGTVKSRLHRAKKRLADQLQTLSSAPFEGARTDA